MRRHVDKIEKTAFIETKIVRFFLPVENHC